MTDPRRYKWKPEDYGDVSVPLDREDVEAFARVNDILGGNVVELRLPGDPPRKLEPPE